MIFFEGSVRRTKRSTSAQRQPSGSRASSTSMITSLASTTWEGRGNGMSAATSHAVID